MGNQHCALGVHDPVECECGHQGPLRSGTIVSDTASPTTVDTYTADAANPAIDAPFSIHPRRVPTSEDRKPKKDWDLEHLTPEERAAVLARLDAMEVEAQIRERAVAPRIGTPKKTKNRLYRSAYECSDCGRLFGVSLIGCVFCDQLRGCTVHDGSHVHAAPGRTVPATIEFTAEGQ